MRGLFVFMAALSLLVVAGCGGSGDSDESVPVPVPRYRMVDYGARLSTIIDINNRGDILGIAPGSKAVILRGEATDVVFDEAGPHRSWHVVAMNDQGQVAATRLFDPSWKQTEAVLWENGVTRHLGKLGGSKSVAIDISDNGDVIGHSYVGSPNVYGEYIQYHPFLWRNGQMIDINPPGVDYSRAVAVNAHGQILISSNVGDYLWQNGQARELRTPSGEHFGALDINDDGVLFGRPPRSNLDSMALLWPNGETVELISRSHGARFVLPGALNNRGQVVLNAWMNPSGGEAGGSVQRSRDLEEPPPNVYLYSGGFLYDLRTLVEPGSGGELGYVDGINDNGVIFGRATFNGKSSPVVLFPL